MELPENPNKKIGELFNEGFQGLDKVNNCTEATNSSTVQVIHKISRTHYKLNGPLIDLLYFIFNACF